jgi:hypothetical protein
MSLQERRKMFVNVIFHGKFLLHGSYVPFLGQSAILEFPLMSVSWKSLVGDERSAIHALELSGNSRKFHWKSLDIRVIDRYVSGDHHSAIHFESPGFPDKLGEPY